MPLYVSQIAETVVCKCLVMHGCRCLSSVTSYLAALRNAREYRSGHRGHSTTQSTSRSSSRDSCAHNAGGHTSEMLKLVRHLSPEIYTPLWYVIASTDHTSAKRIPAEHLESGRCRLCKIPRSREVSELGCDERTPRGISLLASLEVSSA